MRRVCVLANASGCGKTVFGRELAERLGVSFHELDALNHGPNWSEATDEELHAQVAPLVAESTWVVDNPYRRKLGDLVTEAADTVVWLDLPIRVWLPRLVRRTVDRAVRREELWNGNRETLRGALLSRDSLVLYALRTHRSRRRRYPHELACFRLARLRTVTEVAAFLAAARPPAGEHTVSA